MDDETVGRLEVALERLLKPRDEKDGARLLRAVALGFELAAEVLERGENNGP